MNKYALILAGGSGTRFWPLSRHNFPKQLLDLNGEGAMINQTTDRLKGYMEEKDIFVITNSEQEEALRGVAEPQILPDNILIEPCAKNTAPCILYAALHIFKKYGDGILFVFPSDHAIDTAEQFQQTLHSAEIAAQSGALVTIGIPPSFPATGYGYIKCGSKNGDGALEALDFVEKPDEKTAKAYIESGSYLWNSGIFVFTLSAVCESFRRYLPRLYNALAGLLESDDEQAFIAKSYPNLRGISLDYGILERSDSVLCVPATFSWSDVGSFDRLSAILKPDPSGNITKGDIVCIDSSDCVFFGRGKCLLSAIGLRDIIAVDTDDALLICKKERAQEVSKIVEILKKQGRTDLI